MRSCAHGPNKTGVLLFLLCFSLFPERTVRGSKGHVCSGVTILGWCASVGSGQVVRMSVFIVIKTVFYMSQLGEGWYLLYQGSKVLTLRPVVKRIS